MAAGSEQKQYHTGGWSAHYVMIVCTLLFVINYMDRQVFSAVLQPMKVDLGLTDAQCGLVATIFTLGMALFSFPIAYMVDRWSRKKAVGIMAILWSGFTFATGMATNFVALIIPRALVGLGEAGFVPGGNALISNTYSKENRGKAMGIFNMAIPIGAAAGVMLGGFLSAKYGWRTPFFYFAIPGVILGIMAFFMKDYKTVQSDTGAGSKGFLSSLGDILKLPTVRWLYPALGLMSFMSVSLLIWMPTLFMRVLNVNEGYAGMVVGLIGLAAIIGLPLGGFLTDFWYKKDPRGRMFLPGIAVIVSAVLVTGMILLKLNTLGIILGAIYGITITMAIPAFATVYLDIVPPARRGLSSGLGIFVQYFLGGAWGPLVVGAISDAMGGGANGLSMALLVTTGVGIIGALCYFFGAKAYAADADKVKHEAVMAA
jgi:MFS family permease